MAKRGRPLNKPKQEAREMLLQNQNARARNANMIAHGYAGIGDVMRATRISRPTLYHWYISGQIEGCRLGKHIYLKLLSLLDMFADDENFAQYFAVKELGEELRSGRDPKPVPRLGKHLRSRSPRTSD